MLYLGTHSRTVLNVKAKDGLRIGMEAWNAVKIAVAMARSAIGTFLLLQDSCSTSFTKMRRGKTKNKTGRGVIAA